MIGEGLTMLDEAPRLDNMAGTNARLIADKGAELTQARIQTVTIFAQFNGFCLIRSVDRHGAATNIDIFPQNRIPNKGEAANGVLTEKDSILDFRPKANGGAGADGAMVPNQAIVADEYI